MAGLIGQLFGAALMMALIGYLGAWLLRKVVSISSAQSLAISVPIVTVLGGWLYTFGAGVPFLTAWPIYAVGGIIALPFMLLGDVFQSRRAA